MQIATRDILLLTSILKFPRNALLWIFNHPNDICCQCYCTRYCLDESKQKIIKNHSNRVHRHAVNIKVGVWWWKESWVCGETSSHKSPVQGIPKRFLLEEEFFTLSTVCTSEQIIMSQVMDYLGTAGCWAPFRDLPFWTGMTIANHQLSVPTQNQAKKNELSL